MRIAVSGSHRVGKSTLADALAFRLPDHATTAEPYVHLLEDGYDFSDPPELEDFEAQLECSLELLEVGDANVIFDRCPLDFIGYILAQADSGAFDVEEWLPRVQSALETLDLVVFVPIEDPDRIDPEPDADPALREEADDKLKELFRDDFLQLGTEVLEVEGSPEVRAEAVLESVQGLY